MNPDNTVQYNSLSWVKAQLDDVLADAQSNLNEYIENQTGEHLENCIEHLQLVYGTLQMVEVYGASMLAEEMQKTTSALLAGNIERAEDAYDVLMRAMLQLPDYLEGIQSGKKDTPISLMPLINDLRAARRESLLTESVLFSPNIESAQLVSDVYDENTSATGKLQNEVKRLRTHYQLGLLDYIRNNKQTVGLQRIKAVLNALEKSSNNAEVRRIWMVISALVEGLLKEGISTNLSIKALMGNVDRQLKIIVDEGEEAFARKYSKELIKNILYYIGGCTVETRAITAVKKAYHLDDLMPQESDGSGVLVGGLNAELFNTVAKGITEDLDQVKDAVELFMHSSEQDPDQLLPVSEQLVKIADTYGMLGMGATRQLIMQQRTAIESIINREAEVSEKLVLGIASGLLTAESELKNYIASRSGVDDVDRDSDESQAVPAAEYRQVVAAVVAEGLKNFSEAKESILAYLSGISVEGKLESILQQMEEVRGVAMMLSLGRVESQITKLQEYVRVALLNNQHNIDAREQDAVADVVTSIEYFLEALSEGRPGVEQGLNAGDEAAIILTEIAQKYKTIDDDEVPTHRDDLPVETQKASEAEVVVETDEYVDVTDTISDAILAEDVKNDIAYTESNIATDIDASTEQHVDTQNVEQYAILADDADEEIVEIFIEEAIEVLGELHTYYPQWKDNSVDEEALAVVRRSFHTLKGSGRLLGADLIGEFSWKFENMLNRVIDNKITISNNLHQALDEALAVLPQLIEQLKGNREPIDNIAQLMSFADAVAEGRDIAYEADIAKHSEVESEKQDVILETIVPALESVDDASAAEEDLESIEVTTATMNLDIDNIESIDISDISEEIVDIEIEVEELSPEGYGSITEIDPAMNDDEDTSFLDVLSKDDSMDEAVTLVFEEMSNGDDFTVETPAAKFVESDDEESELDEFSADDELSIVIPSLEEDSELSEFSADDEYEIVIDVDDNDIVPAVGVFDIDPMLLKIYYDESCSHVETIRTLLDESKATGQSLHADKNLMRAFHTLYGSARTAEVEAIATLSGAAEKYVKSRQESGDGLIPDAIVPTIRDIEQSISEMLAQVIDGKIPTANKELCERINRIVQQEMQAQLQRSWQESSPIQHNVVELQAEEIEDKVDVNIDVTDISVDASDAQVMADLGVEETAEELFQVSYGDIDDELIDIFLEEAVELLENCDQALNEIKHTPNSIEHIRQLQRNMHTLKGGARMADLKPIGDLTHNLESLIVMVEDNKIDADKRLFDLLHESLDELTLLLERVKTRQSLPVASGLNNSIEMLMRGEVSEKRSVERFDVDLNELHSEDGTEDDFLDLLPEGPFKADYVPVAQAKRSAEGYDERDAAKGSGKKTGKTGERPHWGERVTDVNYKDSQEQVRVRSDLLNNLVNYAGEVNIYHARMGKQVSDFSFNLSELKQTVIRLKDQLRNLEIETEIQIRSGYEKESDNFDDGFDPLEMDQYSTLQQLTRSLSETAGDVQSINEILSDIMRDSETLLLQESRVSTDLQEGLMRTRMVRFGGLTSRLRRIVRQISSELRKEVELELIGEESEVDRTVLDRIIAPLEHMIRNAVAHGIESPEIRRSLGKNESGKIVINVGRQGTNIIIKVKDDGAGIPVDKIRRKAIKQGYITADSNLSDRDILQFILQSGFSTAEEVTQVSGRGVGMDVVDSEIKQLGGVLDIDTTPGKGTEFNVRLPLTLAINQALLVSTVDDVFAVPLASIEGVVRITGHELQRFYDSDNSYYEFNGVEYELKHLGRLLTGRQGNYAKQLQLFPVLLVNVGDKHFALHVEDLIGRREVVVKPVGMQIGAVRGIAGATILADGRVVLILEMSALVVAENLFKTHAPIEDIIEPVVDVKKTIMVVDDSITIRKVTERMLNRYGINVVLAKDGVDATNQLQESIPDLMLLDIEMPRMDGFEVASYVRNDERLKHIPIIMITSRTGSKHKEKAMEIGVNQYLGKPFQEEDLVKNINMILKTSF